MTNKQQGKWRTKQDQTKQDRQTMITQDGNEQPS